MALNSKHVREWEVQEFDINDLMVNHQALDACSYIFTILPAVTFLRSMQVCKNRQSSDLRYLQTQETVTYF